MIEALEAVAKKEKRKRLTQTYKTVWGHKIVVKEPDSITLSLVFFYFIYYFWLLWLFFLLLHTGFLYLLQAGSTLCCGVRASHCGGFSCCGPRALGMWASVVVAHGFSSCGSQALECRLSSCGAQA